MDWPDLNLPVTDPVWIFFIVLAIILLAPILMSRIRIPHIVGMIIAGILIGEHGFNILERDSSFELFGQVGLFYIMFLAGLEMDMEDFRKNKIKGLVFGLLTFSIPIVTGIFSSLYLLGLGIVSSILLASMFAPHTLVSYPIVSRYGLSKQRSVTITIGGTAVTVTLALFILAVIGGMYKETATTGWYWVALVGKVAVLGLLIVLILPRLARWFFRKYDDAVIHFVFVLGTVFLCGGLMDLAGMEGILGAFLAGLTLNSLIPKVSPLMHRLEFVGNALFIPYFLIGVGMIIDLRSMIEGGEALKVAAVMTVIATASKWAAAFATQKIYRMSRTERWMMFGLSNSHAVATLAAVLIGHEIILENGERLLNDAVLNGTVVMILFSCLISSIVTERAAKKFAMEEKSGNQGETAVAKEGKILIPVANPDTIDNLVCLSLLLRPEHSREALIALSVATDTQSTPTSISGGKKLLERAAKVASAADVKVNMVSRYDINVTSGIIHTIKEYDATDLVIGLHRRSGFLDSFFGSLTNNLLKGTFREVIVVCLSMPVNTFKGITVKVPARAGYESGFSKWVIQLCRIAKRLDCPVRFCADEETSAQITEICGKPGNGSLHSIETYGSGYRPDRTEPDADPEELTVIVSSRNNSISYDPAFDRLPSLINRNFSDSSFMIIYPEQTVQNRVPSFSEPIKL